MRVLPSESKYLPSTPREIDEGQIETSGGDAVICRISDEPTARQRLRLIELSGTLDFWDRDEEDIYTLDDGEPL